VSIAKKGGVTILCTDDPSVMDTDPFYDWDALVQHLMHYPPGTSRVYVYTGSIGLTILLRKYGVIVHDVEYILSSLKTKFKIRQDLTMVLAGETDIETLHGRSVNTFHAINEIVRNNLVRYETSGKYTHGAACVFPSAVRPARMVVGDIDYDNKDHLLNLGAMLYLAGVMGIPIYSTRELAFAGHFIEESRGWISAEDYVHFISTSDVYGLGSFADIYPIALTDKHDKSAFGTMARKCVSVFYDTVLSFRHFTSIHEIGSSPESIDQCDIPLPRRFVGRNRKEPFNLFSVDDSPEKNVDYIPSDGQRKLRAVDAPLLQMGYDVLAAGGSSQHATGSHWLTFDLSGRTLTIVDPSVSYTDRYRPLLLVDGHELCKDDSANTLKLLAAWIKGLKYHTVLFMPYRDYVYRYLDGMTRVAFLDHPERHAYLSRSWHPKDTYGVEQVRQYYYLKEFVMSNSLPFFRNVEDAISALFNAQGNLKICFTAPKSDCYTYIRRVYSRRFKCGVVCCNGNNVFRGYIKHVKEQFNPKIQYMPREYVFIDDTRSDRPGAYIKDDPKWKAIVQSEVKRSLTWAMIMKADANCMATSTKLRLYSDDVVEIDGQVVMQPWTSVPSYETRLFWTRHRSLWWSYTKSTVIGSEYIAACNQWKNLRLHDENADSKQERALLDIAATDDQRVDKNAFIYSLFAISNVSNEKADAFTKKIHFSLVPSALTAPLLSSELKLDEEAGEEVMTQYGYRDHVYYPSEFVKRGKYVFSMRQLPVYLGVTSTYGIYSKSFLPDLWFAVIGDVKLENTIFDLSRETLMNNQSFRIRYISYLVRSALGESGYSLYNLRRSTMLNLPGVKLTMLPQSGVKSGKKFTVSGHMLDLLLSTLISVFDGSRYLKFLHGVFSGKVKRTSSSVFESLAMIPIPWHTFHEYMLATDAFVTLCNTYGLRYDVGLIKYLRGSFGQVYRR
jgi:hypothetical protein